MKTIIVPTDFSRCSNNALKLAAQIAKKKKGIIKLIHVYERPVYGFIDIYIDHDKDKIQKAEIHASLAKQAAQDFLEGVEVKEVLIWDLKVWEIFGSKQLDDADLIIMGTHGVTGLDELLIGSNAEKLVRASGVPMITVKLEQKDYTFKDIVFASDFSEEAVKAFRKVQEFAEIFDSKIHLLKVVTPDRFESTRNTLIGVDAFLQQVEGDYPFTVYNDTHKESGIIHYAKDIGANLIALGTHGRSGLSKYFDDSISEGLVNHAMLPVLTLNVDKKAKKKPKRAKVSTGEKVTY